MNRLKTLRIQKGLTQKDIYEYMQVAKSTYSYWETGRTEPDQKSLIKLAKFYNVSVDYLLENDTTEKPTEIPVSLNEFKQQIETTKLANAINDLPQSKQEVVLKVLKDLINGLKQL